MPRASIQTPKLELWFQHDDCPPQNDTTPVALTRTNFECTYKNQRIANETDRYRDKPAVPWTRGVMAHMWYLVKCAADALRFAQNGATELKWVAATNGPIKSIHELATKASDWREWMFGDLGRVSETKESVGIKQLFPESQINLKPHRRLNEQLLPARTIAVFLDEKRVENAQELDRLASNILSQFQKSQQRRGQHSIVGLAPEAAVAQLGRDQGGKRCLDTLQGEAHFLQSEAGSGYAVEVLLVSHSAEELLTRRAEIRYRRHNRTKHVFPLPVRSFEIRFAVDAQLDDAPEHTLQGIVVEQGDAWGRPLKGHLRVDSGSIELILSFPLYLRIGPRGHGLLRFTFTGMEVTAGGCAQPLGGDAVLSEADRLQSDVAEITFLGGAAAGASICLEGACQLEHLIPLAFRAL